MLVLHLQLCLQGTTLLGAAVEPGDFRQDVISSMDENPSIMKRRFHTPRVNTAKGSPSSVGFPAQGMRGPGATWYRPACHVCLPSPRQAQSLTGVQGHGLHGSGWSQALNGHPLPEAHKSRPLSTAESSHFLSAQWDLTVTFSHRNLIFQYY